MNINRILKIIGVIGFVVGTFFASQAKQQLDLADEFMQLSSQCLATQKCENLKNETELLLGLWSGNLKQDLMFVFLSWSVWAGVLIKTNGKSESNSEK